MKKLGSLLLAVVLLMGVLAGCSSGEKENDTNAGKDSAAESSGSVSTEDKSTPTETKTLEFMWFADSETETETMRSILDEYEADHPGIKVELVEVPYADLNQKIMMALSGGEAPALARVTGSNNFLDSALVLNDAFGGSDAFLAQYPESMADFTDCYIKSEDKVIAIPQEASVCAVLYNKTAFETAGVTVPEGDSCWTWDEFNEAMSKCIDSGATRYGLALDRTTQRWTNVFYEFGGSYLDADGNPNFTSDAAKNALEYTKASMDNGLWCKSVFLGGEDAANLFISGQAAAHIGGSWKIGAYYEGVTDFEWGVAYLPYATTRANCTGYKQLMGFEGSGVEEEAAELLVYLASPAEAAWYENCMFISPRLDAGDLSYEFGTEMFATMNEDAAASSNVYFLDNYGHPGYMTGMNTVIIDTVCEYIAGEITVEECMEEIDRQSAEVLAGLGE